MLQALGKRVSLGHLGWKPQSERRLFAKERRDSDHRCGVLVAEKQLALEYAARRGIEPHSAARKDVTAALVEECRPGVFRVTDHPRSSLADLLLAFLLEIAPILMNRMKEHQRKHRPTGRPLRV